MLADEHAPHKHNMANTTRHPRSIIFVHPNLGIGGAERLVIDAAVGLQSYGHKVTVFTSYRDTNHCFEEARDGTPVEPPPLQHGGNVIHVC